MELLVLMVHLFVAIAMVIVVLLQKFDGSALGLGGGGGPGNFMTGRGAANVLTRATAICAGLFFLTSITLTLLAQGRAQPETLFGGPSQSADPLAPVTDPAAPANQAAPEVPPAAPSPAPAEPQVPTGQ